MRKIALAAFIFFCAGAAFAAFEPLGYGAAAKAMGGAYTAKADESSAVYWNPGALAFAKTRELATAFEDVNGLGVLRYAVAGYSQPGVGDGSVGLALFRLETIGEASFLKYAENTYAFAYGCPIGKRIGLGAGLRYYDVDADQKAAGVGFDGGLLLRTAKDGARFGLSLQNINKPKLRWGTGAVDTLPLSGSAGLLFKIGSVSDLSFDEGWRSGDGSAFRAGMSHALVSGRLILRAGVHRAQGQDQWGYSFGGGLKLEGFSVDYAWDHHQDLGDSQNIAVALHFQP